VSNTINLSYHDGMSQLDLAPSRLRGLPRFHRADPSTFLHKFILMNVVQK
jgi:hypothetical protein